jgi:hypothetical protein
METWPLVVAADHIGADAVVKAEMGQGAGGLAKPRGRV